MNNNLEIKMELSRLHSYLIKNPTEALRLALNHLEDFLELAVEIKVLEEKLESVMADNQKLTSQLIEMYCDLPVISPSIESISMLN